MKEAVRDGSRELRACGELAIEMKRVVIAGQLRESSDVRRCHRAAYGCGLADMQFVKPVALGVSRHLIAKAPALLANLFG